MTMTSSVGDRFIRLERLAGPPDEEHWLPEDLTQLLGRKLLFVWKEAAVDLIDNFEPQNPDMWVDTDRGQLFDTGVSDPMFQTYLNYGLVFTQFTNKTRRDARRRIRVRLRSEQMRLQLIQMSKRLDSLHRQLSLLRDR